MTAAFWELYLYEVGSRLGWRLEPHPDVPGTANHPDFLVESGAGRFYLEAVVAAPGTPEQAAAERVAGRVYDLLNEVDSPNFFLSIEPIEAGTESPPVRPLRSRLGAWLRTLDPDEVSARFDTPNRTHPDTPKWTHPRGSMMAGQR